MSVNPQRDLANALRRAQAISPSHILRGSQLSRAERTLLLQRGFLVEIIRGWYALATPQARPGDTTFWHLHFWAFVAAYLQFRFKDRYCVSAEHSLDLWTAGTQTPKQLIVLSHRGGSLPLTLPNGSSILIYPNKNGLPAIADIKQGVRVMPLAVALVRATPTYFMHSATNAELGLRMVRSEDLSRALLSGDVNLSAAGRIVGSLRHLGLNEAAARIDADLTAAGLVIKARNPFEEPPRLAVGTLLRSPYAGRIEAMWARMREDVLTAFPAPPATTIAPGDYLARVNEIYAHDAYHSLSIEGYQVTPDLIQRIADGAWNPTGNPEDQAQVNAMAAKGYHEAFQQVLLSVGAMLKGGAPGKVVERDLQAWYRALFSPSVQAGIMPASALAGYRERRVFIRGSEHVPPAVEAVPFLMDAFFQSLSKEESPAVRAVLGHFIFVFIHPYADGNGRLGRLLMNTMLASGGYDWAVIRVEHRQAYMAALETASVKGDLVPFAQFLAGEMKTSASLPPRTLKEN